MLISKIKLNHDLENRDSVIKMWHIAGKNCRITSFDKLEVTKGHDYISQVFSYSTFPSYCNTVECVVLLQELYTLMFVHLPAEFLLSSCGLLGMKTYHLTALITYVYLNFAVALPSVTVEYDGKTKCLT